MVYRDYFSPEERNAYNISWHAKRRSDAIQRLGGKCVCCGSINNLEFDHIDRTTKQFEISKIVERKKLFEEEIKKCQLLCST